jgi:hypothetical protein
VSSNGLLHEKKFMKPCQMDKHTALELLITFVLLFMKYSRETNVLKAQNKISLSLYYTDTLVHKEYREIVAVCS